MRVSSRLGAVMIFVFLTAVIPDAASEDIGGIILENTRVIYPESASKGISYTVTNRTGNMYLLQARVVPWETVPGKYAPAAPFIVIPPLARFAADDALTVRIRLTKKNLPTDRESVFALSLKAIPGESARSGASEANVALALQNNLKLFYRPAQLPAMDAEARARALQFTFDRTGLRVHNPTPYYITLREIKADGQAVSVDEIRLLAPFSTVSVSPPVPQARSLSWRIIDDDGNPTSPQHQSLP